MSDFWAAWVMALVVINYVVIFLLFLWARKVSIPIDDEGTTGHSWAHGTIREGLNPLPKWWLIMSSAAFAAALVYLVLYPGFGNHKGVLGWTSLNEAREDIATSNAKMDDLIQQIDSQTVLQLSKNEQAMRLGTRLFEDNCAACHGYDAKGIQLMGAPNLTDNTWLYGGKVRDILHTITNGRTGVMPAHQSSLSEEAIAQVSHYVRSLSDLPHDESAASEGKTVFNSVCFACHMMDGKGNQMLGAPNLTDNIWLYGSSLEQISDSVRYGRHGKMPAWNDRLNEQQIKVLAAWVLSHDNATEAIASGDK